MYAITLGVGALGLWPSIEGSRRGSRQQRLHSEAEGAVHVLTYVVGQVARLRPGMSRMGFKYLLHLPRRIGHANCSPTCICYPVEPLYVLIDTIHPSPALNSRCTW